MMEDRRKLTQDLLQIRVILEPPIAALAAQNASEEDLRKLEEILLEVEELIVRRRIIPRRIPSFTPRLPLAPTTR